MKSYWFKICLSLLFLVSCGNSDTIESSMPDENNNQDTNETTNTWLLPLSQVRDGGPGRDGIPSINSPKFISADQVPAQMRDEVRVIGIKVGDELRAYPHYILDWHEIVNDDIKNTSVAITYCPLTGSGVGWNRKINGNKTSFGVSGLLYNNNLIPFDRATNSNWSQLALQCVNGKFIGEMPEIIKVIETNWFIWKAMFPDTKVLSLDTGFSRTYGVYPYGDYITNNDRLIFPLTRDDKRLPKKERVHAIIDGDKAKAYRFNSFGGGKVIKDNFEGKEILLVGGNETIISFELNNETSGKDYEYVFNHEEAYFKDNEGTEYNVFGEAISGPSSGQALKTTNSFIAYWFSIGAFYSDTQIFE